MPTDRLLLTFLESREPTLGGPPVFHNQLYPTRCRTGTQQPEQFLATLARTLRYDMDPAVASVTRRADQTQFERPGPGPPAKAHTLHLPVHPRAEPDGFAHESTWNDKFTADPAFSVRPTVHTLSMARCTVTSSRCRPASSSSDRSSSMISFSSG